MKFIFKVEIYSIKKGLRVSDSIQALSKISFAILMFFWIVGCSSDEGRFALAPDLFDPMTESTMTVPVPPNDDGSQTALSQLYGRILFTHRFSSGEILYIYDGEFGPEDLIGEDFNDLSLLDTFASVRRVDENSEFESLVPEDLICGYLESVDRFLCNVFFESGARDNFLFGTLVDNESLGSYTFCSAEISNSECADELVDSPDGTVLVSVTSQIIASRINLENLDAAKKLSSGNSVLPYLEYENQGSLGTISDRSSASSEIAISIMDAFEEHIALTKPVDLY